MNELTTFSPKTCSLTKVDNPLDADARASLPQSAPAGHASLSVNVLYLDQWQPPTLIKLSTNCAPDQ